MANPTQPNLISSQNDASEDALPWQNPEQALLQVLDVSADQFEGNQEYNCSRSGI